MTRLIKENMQQCVEAIKTYYEALPEPAEAELKKKRIQSLKAVEHLEKLIEAKPEDIESISCEPIKALLL